ncbi:MAG: hypothetical protein J6U54_23285, partial [Clostridiales bacterium]|nr:hypothetical protein [Clostridiales bacterium]
AFVLGGCNAPVGEEMEELKSSKATTETTGETTETTIETTTEATSDGTLGDDDLKKLESNREAADIDIIEHQLIRDLVNEYIDDPKWNFMNYEHMELDLEDKFWIVEGVFITTAEDGIKARGAYLFDSYDHAMDYVNDTEMELVFEEQDDGSINFDNTNDSEMKKDYYGTIYPDGSVIEYMDFD